MFGIRNTAKIKSYCKTGVLAAAVTLGMGIKRHSPHPPVMPKDIVEFAEPAAARLIKTLENGKRHSKAIMIFDTKKRFIRENEMRKYEVVSQNTVDKYKALEDSLPMGVSNLPDSIEVFYKVYNGRADAAIQKALGREGTVLTVGHGNTGIDYIELAGGVRLYEGDYASRYTADSLFNQSIIKKDSILRANISKDAYKALKQNEKTPILTYMYNVHDSILKKHVPKRIIPESFFECLTKGLKGKVQAKFNIRPSADEALCGLMKRNLIQLLIYGNGEVYLNEHSLENFYKTLEVLKKRKDKEAVLSEVIDIVSKQGVNKSKFKKTIKMMEDFMEIGKKK